MAYEHVTSTGSVLCVQFSNLGDHTGRKKRFGGGISQFACRKVGPHTYVFERGVKIERLSALLDRTLLSSDGAVLAYPQGKTDEGSSAMRVRLYGKAAE